MKYYLAIDIGGTNVKWGVVSEEGTILKKGKFPTPKGETAVIEDLVGKIGEAAQELKQEYEFVGLAMSAPGSVNNESGYIAGASALPYIHGPHIRKLVEEATGLKMQMENDANCAALAEVWKGAAASVSDSIFIIIGTGIGGAVIKDKKLHSGKNLFAGEFGFMILEADFENLNFHTLSALGATSVLIHRVEDAKGLERGTLSGEEVFRLAESGDLDAVDSVNKFYNFVAMGIFNLQHIYDPEKVIIGGAISARPDIVDQINERLILIREHFKITSVEPDVVVCAYKGDANLIGAVYNYMAHADKDGIDNGQGLVA